MKCYASNDCSAKEKEKKYIYIISKSQKKKFVVIGLAEWLTSCG